MATINYYPANYIANAAIMSWAYNGTPGSQTTTGNISFPWSSGTVSEPANQVVLLTFQQSLLSSTPGSSVIQGQHFTFNYTPQNISGNGFLVTDSQKNTYYATDGYVVSPNQLALVLNSAISINGPQTTNSNSGIQNVTVENSPLPVNDVKWSFHTGGEGGAGVGYAVENNSMPTITPQDQTYAYVEYFVNYSKDNNNALNSSVSTTPLANGGQIVNFNGPQAGVANPAAQPTTVAFQLSPSLIYYLYDLGYHTLQDMYNAVTISIPSAGGTAYFPALTVDGQTTAGQRANAGLSLAPSTNYSLGQLYQSLPSANFTNPISITLPNIQLNELIGGTIQIGIAGQQVAPSNFSNTQVVTTTPTQLGQLTFTTLNAHYGDIVKVSVNGAASGEAVVSHNPTSLMNLNDDIAGALTAAAYYGSSSTQFGAQGNAVNVFNNTGSLSENIKIEVLSTASAQLKYSSTNLQSAPSAGAHGFMANIEPHIGTAATSGASATQTTIDDNADLTNINGYSIPISLETFSTNGAPFNLSGTSQASNYNGTTTDVFNINGGAGFYNQLSNSTAVYNALVNSAESGSSNVVNNIPLGPSNVAGAFAPNNYPYHDWSHYWSETARGTTSGNLFTPTKLVSGGSESNPTDVAGNQYSFTTYFFDGNDANTGKYKGGYAILVNNTTMYGSGSGLSYQLNGVQGGTKYAAGTISIYIPFDSAAPNAQDILGKTATYLNDAAGMYGANADYAIYYDNGATLPNSKTPTNLYTAASTAYNIATPGNQWTAASSAVVAELSNETMLFSTNQTSNALPNNTPTHVVGDLEAGFNFGLIGSTTKYSNKSDITTPTAIGNLMSFQWFENQTNGGSGLTGNIGPVAAGVWGPWAQPQDTSTTAPSQQANSNTVNADWNTWSFAVSGYTQPSTSTVAPTTYYASTSNLSNGSISPLMPNVYNFAFSDRVISVSTQFAPTSGGTNAPSGPNGTVGGAGFELVTLGSPANYTNSANVTTQFTFNNTNQVQYWYALVDYNATSSNISTYGGQLDNGTNPLTVIQQILADPITTQVVNPTIAYYQTALGRVPSAIEGPNTVNYIDGATMTQAPTLPTPVQVFNGLMAGAPYLFASAEFKTDMHNANVSTNVTATSTLQSMSQSDITNYITYLYKNDFGPSFNMDGIVNYWLTTYPNLTAAQLIVTLAMNPTVLGPNGLGNYITAHQNAEITQTEIGAVGYVQGQPLQSLLFYHT